mmetsp:Transcript_676/g.2335  ORF Transcript_676/g.2335 Transcript_676/m.2335 type:complete len:81 (+) Transcript_676:532-774(+)|eukprot:scaffold307537_cov40-Tisochrysis_lutea.AAC.2
MRIGARHHRHHGAQGRWRTVLLSSPIDVAVARQVDDAGTQMRSAMVVMKKMLKNKDRGKFCAIFVLTIVLIILTMAVFSF